MSSRLALTLLLVVGVFSSALFAKRPAVYKAKKEKLPQRVARQPVLFSHRKHVALGLGCLDCHADAREKERAGLSDAGKCMACHKTLKTGSPEVRKLAKAFKRGEPIEWVHIYRVPAFVFFNHANHLKMGLECAACHGPVHERDVLAKEVSTGMTFCMDCHRARKVSTECHLCHSLGY